MENFFDSDKNDSLLHIYAGDVQCFIKILLQSTNKTFQSSVDKRAKKCTKNIFINHNYLFGVPDNYCFLGLQYLRRRTV